MSVVPDIESDHKKVTYSNWRVLNDEWNRK